MVQNKELLNCPKCGSKPIKNGFGHDFTQHYLCKKCSYDFSAFTDFNTPQQAKILLVDIETAPIKALVWRVWKENISIDQIKSDWFMLTWSAKWLNDSEVHGDRLTSSEAKKENDKRISRQLWNLFDTADIIIAHNGNSFDIPKINSRFLLNGLKPPSPYRTIDTLLIARKKFGFSHNKLDYLASLLGFGHKHKTDFELWVKCLEGDDDSLAYMLKYNKRDVQLLEDVYLKMRGWVNSHPNVNMYSGGNGCANCGSENVHKKGIYMTSTGKFESYQCNDCGAFSRQARKTKISTAR